MRGSITLSTRRFVACPFPLLPVFSFIFSISPRVGQYNIKSHKAPELINHPNVGVCPVSCFLLLPHKEARTKYYLVPKIIKRNQYNLRRRGRVLIDSLPSGSSFFFPLIFVSLEILFSFARLSPFFWPNFDR